MYTYVHTMCVYVCVRMSVCMCACVCVCMCKCMCECTRECVGIYVCTSVCVCLPIHSHHCHGATRTERYGRVTHTMWARFRGLSGDISGNMGWGGSRLEAQLRDLLSAWDSFLAGDFWRKTEDTGEMSGRSTDATGEEHRGYR